MNVNDVKMVKDVNEMDVNETVNGELIWETFFSQLLYTVLDIKRVENDFFSLNVHFLSHTLCY